MPRIFVCILTVRESFLVGLRHWGTGEPSKDKFLRRDHYKDFDLWHQTDGMQFGQEVRSVGKQLSSIINFLLSIIATFTFGYIASQYAFPSIAVRVIIGVLLAFIVAIAELYFMARVEI
ncbi:transmembrane protein 199-like isoform X1 [Pocillopora verrucosa]|uniref:transmembrane protein 199-like isoform X1 n=1 Tax=Pocillopora verrucosa TaxID=203993 RepID=UPI0033422528